MVTDHGDVAGGHYRQWFRDRHPDWRELTDRKNELPHNYSCPQSFRTPIPEDSYSTAFIRERAQHYLRRARGQDEPFFAFVSFPDPHHPFNPPGRYWDLYDPEDFDIPVRFADHRNPPPPLLHAKETFDAGRTPATPQMCFMADDRHIREAMALTAGMITMIDDAVGEIIDVLHETGQYDDTVIIVNADHGDYLGDFNLMLKGEWPKDSITRVPMIWSDPDGRESRASRALASTVDLAPTILERAGVRPYFGMQGVSLTDAVNGGAGLRDSLLIEFNSINKRMGFDPPARVRVLVSDDWHLAVYKGEDWGELYDRTADPTHLHNLWDSGPHAAVRSDLTLRLTHHLIGQMDESPRSQFMA